MKLSFWEWFQLFESDETYRSHFDQFRTLFMDPYIKALLDFGRSKPEWLDKQSEDDLKKYYQSMAFLDELGFKFGKSEYGDKFLLGSAHPDLIKIIDANIKNPTTGDYNFKNEIDFQTYLAKAPSYNPRNRPSTRIAQIRNVHDLLKFLFHQRLANATANLQKKAGLGQTGEEGGDLEGTLVGQHRTAAQVKSTETVNSIIDCLREFYGEVEKDLQIRLNSHKSKVDNLLNDDDADPVSLSAAKLHVLFYCIAKVFNDKSVIEREYDGIMVPTTTDSLKSQQISQYLSRTGQTLSKFLNDNREFIGKFLRSDPVLTDLVPQLFASTIYLMNISRMDRSQYADYTKNFVASLPASLKTSMSEEHLKNLRLNYLVNNKLILTTSQIPPAKYSFDPDGLLDLLLQPNFPVEAPVKNNKFVSPIFLLLGAEGTSIELDCKSLKARWKKKVYEAIN